MKQYKITKTFAKAMIGFGILSLFAVIISTNFILKADSTTDSLDNTTQAPTETIVASSTQTFDITDVVITTPDSKINAGDKFRVIIENKSNFKINYEIGVDDLKTKEYLKKAGGSIEANKSLSTWAAITSPGTHDVSVYLIDIEDGHRILARMFGVSVLNSGNPSEEKAIISNSATNSSADTEIEYPNLKPSTIPNVGTLLNRGLEFLEYFVGTLGFVGFLISGIMFGMSEGNPEKAQKAKKAMIYTAIGIALSVMALVLTKAGFFVVGNNPS